MYDPSMSFVPEYDPSFGSYESNNTNWQNFELVGRRAYTNCNCMRRNGLQDNCPRPMCQGKSGYMNVPSPNCVPSPFTNITMGINKQMQSYEASGDGLKQQSDFASYNTPLNGYQGHQSDMQLQMPTGVEYFPSPTSNGMSGTLNWNNGHQQGNYPCYL